MDISVVIPVYGCKKALPELYKRLTTVLSDLCKDYEIILVNDACPQNSWEIIETLCKEDKHVIGLELSRNFGQLRATTAGLDRAKGEWIVVMDCDLQDRPEEIPRLLSKAQEGYDVVFARRSERKDNKFKIWVSNCFYQLYSYATDQSYDGAVCNFSIARKKVIEEYRRIREYHRGYVMYIRWMGFKEAIVDVEHLERYEGKSGYNLKKRLRLASELLTSQSDKFIRLTAKIGIIISIISFVFIIYSIINYFTGNVSNGWTSVIASIFFMGGLVISSIGVVGIYVGNIFMEVKHRPLYIVRQQLNGDQHDEK